MENALNPHKKQKELENEARLERAVKAQLECQPLYAFELARGLGEDHRAVAQAVVQLLIAEAIGVPRLGARFEVLAAQSTGQLRFRQRASTTVSSET
jgi:hypothetical protein